MSVTAGAVSMGGEIGSGGTAMRAPRFRTRTLMIATAVVGSECALLLGLCKRLCGHATPLFFDDGPWDPWETGEGIWLLLNLWVIGPGSLVFWARRAIPPR